MNRFLRGLFPGTRRPTTGSTRDEGWRRVPRINLLTGQGKGVSSRLVVGALIVVLLAEAVAALTWYSSGADARDNVKELEQSLEALRSEDDRISSDIQALQSRIDGPAQGSSAEQSGAETELSQRIDWGTALTKLFDAEVPGVTFDSVIALPETSETGLLASADSVGAIVAFQSRLREVSDTLELQSLSWEEGEGSLDLTVGFQVLRGRADEKPE